MSLISTYDRVVVSRRLDGDGMDNEDLQTSQHEHSHTSISPPSTLPKRHHNLVTTLKAAHVNKEASPKFIPHEPVKGAVKPVSIPSPWQQEKPSKADLNGGAVVTEPQSDVAFRLTSTPPAVVETKGNQKRRSKPASAPCPSDNQHLIHSTPPDEEREVEGSCRSNDERLLHQVEALKDQLNVQIKVNGDLKKLLVASVGDDLHHKVESLVRTKAHLATEIGGYTQKMTQDYEHLDHLAIEADKWRSKYMASKMLLENVSHERDAVIGQLRMSRSALRDLLQERNTVRECLLQTHRYLKLVRDSFDPQASRKSCVPVRDCIELARANQKLGEAVKFRLLGSMPMLATALDYGILDGLTPSESTAFQVIAQGDACLKLRETLSPASLHYQRFHPRVRYENVTYNCCRKCKGDIQVV